MTRSWTTTSRARGRRKSPGVLAALRDQLVPLVAAIRTSGRCARHGHPRAALPDRGPGASSASESPRRSVSISTAGGSTSRPIRSAPKWARTIAGSPLATTSAISIRRSSAFCTKRGTACTNKDCRRASSACRRARTSHWAFTNRNRRMWENLVGRSRAFWDYAYRAGAAGVSRRRSATCRIDAFYFAINDVRPSLIRVEADEVTYNLHILIRFELEQALINDELAVGRPAGGVEREVSRLSRPDAAERRRRRACRTSTGAGLFGYFPTYSLGNLYASQFFAQADREVGGLEAMFRRRRIHAAARMARGENPQSGPAIHCQSTGRARDRIAAVAGLANAAPTPEV